MIRLVHVFALCAVLAAVARAQPLDGLDGGGGFMHFRRVVGGGGPEGAGMPEPPRFLGRLFPPSLVMRNQDAIGLSEAQRQTMKTAMVDAERELLDLRWSLEAESEKVDTLLARDPVDEAAVLAQMERVLAAESKLKLRHLALLVRIRNALTPEQRSKLAGMRWQPPPPPPQPGTPAPE